MWIRNEHTRHSYSITTGIIYSLCSIQPPNISVLHQTQQYKQHNSREPDISPPAAAAGQTCPVKIRFAQLNSSALHHHNLRKRFHYYAILKLHRYPYQVRTEGVMA